MKQSFNLLLVPLLLLASCSQPKPQPREAKNGIYYWRTTFCPTDEERAFVRDHNISRIYLHLYDVDQYYSYNNESYDIVPRATIQFQDSLIDGVEYVPTVYITQDALHSMKGHEKELAQKIVTRTLNMVDYHDIPNVQEMQIDGDWQQSTRKSYFRLCKELRRLLHQRGMTLSATIRLAQLREPVPPVDYGVLMLYNTNSVRSASTENSILSLSTCRDYLGHDAIEHYDLHLDYALPTFAWSAVFDNDGSFSHLLTTTMFDDPDCFQQIDSTHYRVKCWMYGDPQYGTLYYNYSIRVETTSAEQLQQLLEMLPVSDNTSILLYHLDSKQVNRYSYEEVDSFFAR